MKKLKLIRDGMNLPFKVAPFGDNEAVLTGVYRPLPPAEVADLQAELEKLKGKNRVPVVAKAIAARIVSWDATDDGGVPAAADAAAVAALPAAYLDPLELIVCGYAASGAAADDEKKS